MSLTKNNNIPPLSKQMLVRADHDHLPEDHPLRVAANELTKTMQETSGRLSEANDAKRILRSWAKARGEWCRYSGEDLF